MFRRNLQRHALLCWCLLAGGIAMLLKYQYSIATAADLDWMLQPLALLLQTLTGHAFQPGSTGEWHSTAAGIALVKACAGINFMTMSFLGWCWIMRPPASGFRWYHAHAWPVQLATALLLAWVTALAVNLARILLVLAVGPALDPLLGAAAAHRLFGLLVYLSALLAQLLIFERRLRTRAVAVAIAIYGLVMLLVPLLSGQAWLRPAQFGAHALMVLLALLVPVLWIAGAKYAKTSR